MLFWQIYLTFMILRCYKVIETKWCFKFYYKDRTQNWISLHIQAAIKIFDQDVLRHNWQVGISMS